MGARATSYTTKYEILNGFSVGADNYADVVFHITGTNPKELDVPPKPAPAEKDDFKRQDKVTKVTLKAATGKKGEKKKSARVAECVLGPSDSRGAKHIEFIYVSYRPFGNSAKWLMSGWYRFKGDDTKHRYGTGALPKD